MLLNRAKSEANQKPFVENRSWVVLVEATMTQYTGIKKYTATTIKMPVTNMVDPRVAVAPWTVRCEGRVLPGAAVDASAVVVTSTSCWSGEGRRTRG